MTHHRGAGSVEVPTISISLHGGVVAGISGSRLIDRERPHARYDGGNSVRREFEWLG
jgi:hypothetical protein